MGRLIVRDESRGGVVVSDEAIPDPTPLEDQVAALADVVDTLLLAALEG